MNRIQGVVQHYAWGDERTIPSILGMSPDGRPWAEYWLGTHPNGPATTVEGESLSTVTGPLPFLLKLLAAAEPLSLQAHPDAARARRGHESGIYPDPFPKPELLCALTPFDALCGVRPVEATVELLRRLDADELSRAIEGDGIAATLTSLYRGRLDPAPTIERCEHHPEVAEAALVTRLATMYPGEPSVVVTLLLNRVALRPGQAIFLGPGNLHAYLVGSGVELMGASDNVVRGGLTVKDVDVDELLTIVDPTPLADPVIDPTPVVPGVVRYSTGPAPFVLERIDTAVASAPGTHTAARHELLLCTAGGDELWPQGVAVHLAPGESAALPPHSTVYVATTPP